MNKQRSPFCIHVRCLLQIAAAAWLMAMLCPPAPAEAEGEIRKLRTSFFFNDVLSINEKDAEAVVTVFSDLIFTRESLLYRSEPLLFDSAQAAVDSYNKGEVDVLTLNPLDYIDKREQFNGIPLSADGAAEDSDQRLVLLVHRDSKISKLSDLHGKLNILDELNSSLPRLWIDSLLLEAIGATSIEHFSAVVSPKTLMKAVIPVFMRQADACIVTHGGYETMCKLNPQVERSLRVLETSEPLSGMIIIWHPSFPGDELERIARTVHDMHNSVEGSQILEYFRMNRIVPFDPERHLAPSERLITKYRTLIKERNRKLMSMPSNMENASDE